MVKSLGENSGELKVVALHYLGEERHGLLRANMRMRLFHSEIEVSRIMARACMRTVRQEVSRISISELSSSTTISAPSSMSPRARAPSWTGSEARLSCPQP